MHLRSAFRCAGAHVFGQFHPHPRTCNEPSFTTHAPRSTSDAFPSLGRALRRLRRSRPPPGLLRHVASIPVRLHVLRFASRAHVQVHVPSRRHVLVHGFVSWVGPCRVQQMWYWAYTTSRTR